MRLIELQNKHDNEIIFCVGAGSSIKDVDFDIIKNYTIMATNSGILSSSFAKYFVSDDQSIMEWSYFFELEKIKCICLFYDKKFENRVKHLNKERVIFYKHKSWFSPPSTYNIPDGLLLTKDITKPIIGSRTSMGSCVHLAYCMGAKVIVLLGNDCRLSKDNHNYRYFWQHWTKEKQPYRMKGIKFNQNTQNVGFDQKAFIEYWNKFAEVNKYIIEKEVEIIDASDGILDCFPKMSIDNIMEKYGDRRSVI